MDKEEEKGGLILILSPCLPLCFKHYITRDIGRNEGCSEEWRDGKNREEMEKANSGEKEVSSFFNPSSHHVKLNQQHSKAESELPRCG